MRARQGACPGATLFPVLIMRRAIKHHSAGTWAHDQVVATVTLTFDDRHRRRIQLRDDAGRSFLLALPEAVIMADGDGLELESGGFIRVRAADEAVVDFCGPNARETVRLAWHVGNRHVPLQVLDDGMLRIRDDHVIVAMLQGLGAQTRPRQAPFSPERGAYAHDAMHGTHSDRNGAEAGNPSASPSGRAPTGSSHAH